MNFQNLEYFLAVADEGSVTRAAERLHITQQALSSHIARLEAELGCTLLKRRPALELTYSGKCFARAAGQMLELKRNAEDELRDVNGDLRGELRLGISHTRGQTVLPLLLPEFQKRYPLAELSVIEGSTAELEDDLRKGLIDILMGFSPVMQEELVTYELFKEQFDLIVPLSLAPELASGREPDAARLRQLPFILLKKGERIRTIADHEFARRGVQPRVKIETANIQTAFALALEGMGATVYPRTYLNSPYAVAAPAGSPARARVAIFPFYGGDPSDTLVIGYLKSHYLTRMERDFVEMSRRQFAENP
jgi:DNA-binding transcriptional LysR family regulator